MSVVLPLSAGLADRAPACILDARLAFAAGGVLFAVRLSRAAPVWLTRRFWTLVDGAHFYRRYPEELSSTLSGDDKSAATLDALSIWHAAWLNGMLDGAFHWIGDARRESLLPRNCTAEDVNRYEKIAGALLAKTGNAASDPPPDALAACGYEAIALAATLAADAPVILTLGSARPGQAPALCRSAARLGGIGVEGFSKTQRMIDMMPAGIRTLLPAASLAGMRMAAVHVFAPRSLAVAATPAPEEHVESAHEDPSSEREPWAGAQLFWHDIP
jgi:hypothetical protein